MYSNYNSHYNNYYGGGQGVSGSGSNPAGASSSLMNRMNESEAVALLQHLGKEDLQHLLENESKLDDLVQDLAQVRSFQAEHDNLVAQNKSLAEYNLSLQPRFDTLKTQVATAHESANNLKNQLGVNKARLDTYIGDQKLDTLHALMQTEAAKAEEEAEQFADSFCEKNISVEEFVAQFLPQRTLAHKHRIKAEKMGELLRDSHAPSCASAWPSSNTSQPCFPSPSHQSLAQAPYPTGPPPMVGAPYGSGSAYSLHGPSSYGMPDPSLYRR